MYISSWEPITELQSITCHMKSHSVTCHQTQVNVHHIMYMSDTSHQSSCEFIVESITIYSFGRANLA